MNSNMTEALVGLELTPLPPSEAAEFEEFEGDYGGIEYGNEEAWLRKTFEGFNDALVVGWMLQSLWVRQKLLRERVLVALSCYILDLKPYKFHPLKPYSKRLKAL